MGKSINRFLAGPTQPIPLTIRADIIGMLCGQLGDAAVGDNGNLIAGSEVGLDCVNLAGLSIGKGHLLRLHPGRDHSLAGKETLGANRLIRKGKMQASAIFFRLPQPAVAH